MLADRNRERAAARDADYPDCVIDADYPDCVIAVLPDGRAGLSLGETRALGVLADAGLVPPLRPTALTLTHSPAPAQAPAPAPAQAPAPAPAQAPARAQSSVPAPSPEPVSGPGNRRTGSRGAGSRPADPRLARRRNTSHPQLKSHGPQPTARRDRQDRVESRRIG